MGSFRRSRLPAKPSSLHSLKSCAKSMSGPYCQSDLTHGLRRRGIFEFVPQAFEFDLVDRKNTTTLFALL